MFFLNLFRNSEIETFHRYFQFVTLRYFFLFDADSGRARQKKNCEISVIDTFQIREQYYEESSRMRSEMYLFIYFSLLVKYYDFILQIIKNLYAMSTNVT